MTKIDMNKAQYDAGMLLEGALDGDRKDTVKFFEAFTISDMPVLLVPAINKRVLAVYDGIPSEWQKIAGTESVDDFRLQQIVRPYFVDNGILPKTDGETYVQGTLPRVNELGEYQTLTLAATESFFRIFKSGIKASFSWEELVNGRSVSILEKFWNEFAVRARNTEAAEAFKQFIGSAGLNTTNLTDGSSTGTNNLLAASSPYSTATNAPLSADALKAALAQAAQHKLGGKRIGMPAKFNLVVPSTLETRAKEILAVQQVRFSKGTITSGGVTETISTNILTDKFNLVVDDTIIKINPNADAYWFIVPEPNAIPDMGAYVGFLRGAEAPRVFVKTTTMQNPEDGDFDHDAYETKTRTTATGFWKGGVGVVASTGAGS